VQSHLGEPLRARIALIDPPRELLADCFSVRDGHDASLPGLAGAHLALDMHGANPVLRITSKQPVDDPILQISVASACPESLQRDYVLLLDPPAAVELATVPDADKHAASAQTSQDAAATDTTALANTQGPQPQRVHAARRPHPAAQPPSARHRPSPAPVAAPAASVGKPGGARLIVSSSDTVQPGRPGAAPPVENLRQLQEDNTALSHRLAHLEAELAALQKQNQALDRARLRAAAPPPAPVIAAAAPDTSWPRLLIALAVLTAGLALALAMRRRSHAGGLAKAATRREKIAPVYTPSAALTPVSDEATRPMPGYPEQAADTLPAPTPLPFNAPRFQIPNDGTEVKEDILDQAEVFMAHGHASLAIHLLEEHLRASPTESPVPWLLLLDLQKREGLDADYKATCLECQTHFNVNLSAPPAAAPTPDGGSIEAYPHVAARLQELWGTPAAIDFLSDLVYDHRGGTRLGFDSGTYREIVLLRSMALEFAEAESAERVRQL
jgi:hypothetical protein